MTMSCTPSGCQCPCHRAMAGMTVSHLVACCAGEDLTRAQVSRLWAEDWNCPEDDVYDGQHCPDCGAAMDLRLAGTFNAHWECPFDQQIVWVNVWTE